jgi:hypothetical protein
MTWPGWLSGPESFALGVIVGILLAMFYAAWLLDRLRRHGL